MAKKWDYYIDDARTHSYGLMICSACGNKITKGEFRVRETEDAYITQHRSCSHTDGQWARRDAQRENRIRRAKDQLAAAIEFRDRWGTEALNDEIDDLEALINKLQADQKEVRRYVR
ncbi:hypothetical protein GCM10011348_46260 [Marinobacterium nitratireducens]|uniref:Uncharacterized protein n=1 Tax=Marinobacterium nitratireducens TaxID=518897 RepID=A0A918DXV0_9GAMM|nr:hypothetical protein [Marinobacterium nitratireducens]GGO89160.1 hypothetical protein GCM10011348_46260 [Marinobacterium nitratireducens]